MDYCASTPCDSLVIDRMIRLLKVEYANPSSSHKSGRRAHEIIEQHRRMLAIAINALPEEIVFTSGATESNNLAIQGVATAAEQSGNPRKRIVTIGTEHPSVLEPCKKLTEKGFKLSVAPIDSSGTVILSQLSQVFGDDTLLFCIQAANNEIGTIQPLTSAAEIAHKHGALVHSDASQAVGKTSFDVETLNIDLASISSHKCYGPKGVGALWLRGGPAKFPISPMFFGGGHEMGIRPGTSNTIGIVGFCIAIQNAVNRMLSESARISNLRDTFESQLKDSITSVRFNGALNSRLPGVSSITIEDIEADALISRLPNFDLSAASACHSGAPEPSHVLRAIGLSEDTAYSTLRVSFGRETTNQQVESAVQHIADSVRELRRFLAYNKTNSDC